MNNDGLHGAVRVCGNIGLTAGLHKVRIRGFQHGGGIYQTADYSGPDTGGQSGIIPSEMTEEDIAALPPVPPPSVWYMRVFKGDRINSMADASKRGLEFIGASKIPAINFNDLPDLRKFVPGTSLFFSVYLLY